MIADSASPPELPPGLLEEYLQGMREQLGLLADLAERLAAAGNDREALETLRRETHKIHGSAGSYGFWGVSRLAAGMEATVKDWGARPDDVDADRASVAQWFIGRLAEGLGLEPPAAGSDHRPRASRTQSPTAEVGAEEGTGVPDVIVVEDDPALAELLEYGLRSRGYHFASFRNGRDALDHLLALDIGRSHPLLLLDVDLPALDGYSIFAALQRERPGAYRVVFTTVHGDESEQLRGLEAGALDYLVKPISLRVALEKVRRWVGK
jgi:CheY-like chemotaxis protein/HPt (histidine-containing phosphotransfer) domain-containing protein